MTNKRPARVRLVHKETREKMDFGAIFTSPWEGTYSLALQVETGEVDDNGYPVREAVTDAKTESGRKFKLSDFFINVEVYETMPSRPAKKEYKTASDFASDSDDF